MKKFTLQLSALLVFFFAGLVANAQIGTGKWSFSNPKPFGFFSWAISYADDNNALVVGEAGGIAKTTDGGGTWAYMSYVTPVDGEMTKPNFNDVQFVSGSLAYAVGNYGVMVKSVDGGLNWTAVNTPFAADKMEINTVFFTDANTGYIGGDGDATTRQCTLYKTTDGGASWQPEYVFPAPTIEWLSAALYKVRFNANGVGYVGGAAGLIWKYQNAVWSDYSITDVTDFPNVHAEDTVYYDNWEGGIDTVVTTYADNTFGLNQQNYRAIAILSDSEVVIGTQNNGGLVRINTATPTGDFLLLNNGSAYAQIYAPIGSPQIYNLCTRDGNTIAGTSSAGHILLSGDRGFTWQSKPVYPEGSEEAAFGFYGIDISPSNRFGLCGMGGVVADSVSSWRKPFTTAKQSIGFSGYGIESISFADAGNGIAAGSGGTMLRTEDGGNSWQNISNPSFNPWDYYTSIAYISPNVLMAAASNGMFYRSADKGTSFDLLFTEDSAGNLAGMHFINEDTGWLAANVMSTNQETWITTYHQVIYRTVDGGLSWDSSNTVLPSTEDYSVNRSLYDIKFLNGNIGYAVGSVGTIYKSIDGGLTWTLQTNIPASETNKIIKSIAIVDENIVFVSGDEGMVMKTIDGGASWQLTNTGLPGGYARFEKILMLDASQGMTFANGNVYTTLDGGANWSVYYAPISDNFKGACLAPITGCSGPVCKKVFAGGFFRGNIMKFDSDIVLPVKFSNLTGTGTAQGNQLFWTAFTQENVNWFEIERSEDGVNFSKLAEKVYPGTAGYQSYQWLDKSITGGRNYYRVKAVERT
ncbi:MAG: YCF48-related protein, partial [Bacteroidota bacterium]